MDHISIAVSDVARTKSFYELVLKPLGWDCSGFRAGVYVGFKKPGSPALYFNASAVVAPAHLAFKAESEEQVMAFHRAALDAGGTDNGGPGPRPAYGAGYYAAFALDADGHNVEAVLGGVG
jgi:catechol 2,3-dioxygenase-like lactoylglutathione lyase family enzyme